MGKADVVFLSPTQRKPRASNSPNLVVCADFDKASVVIAYCMHSAQLPAPSDGNLMVGGESEVFMIGGLGAWVEASCHVLEATPLGCAKNSRLAPVMKGKI